MVGIISVVIGGHFGGGDHFDGGIISVAVQQPAGRWVTACRVRLELMFKMADSRGKDERKFNQLKRPQKASFLNISYVGAVF